MPKNVTVPDGPIENDMLLHKQSDADKSACAHLLNSAKHNCSSACRYSYHQSLIFVFLSGRCQKEEESGIGLFFFVANRGPHKASILSWVESYSCTKDQ